MGLRGYKLGWTTANPCAPKVLIQITGVVSKMLGLDIDLKELVARAKDLARVKPQEGLPEPRASAAGSTGRPSSQTSK